MLETGCVFALDQIEEFYKSCGAAANCTNSSMFFQMSEDGEFYGMIKMQMQGDTLFLHDAVTREENLAYEEFLLKSCINFALTFSCEYIKTSKKYQRFLIDMHFRKHGDALVGKRKEIDFPHPCCGGKG